jgi:hypothetical protein
MKFKDKSLENKAKFMCWAAEKILTKEIAAHWDVHQITIQRHLVTLRKLQLTASL